MARPGAWMRIGAALASGGMMGLLVPPYGVGWLAWVCLVPLLVAVWTLPEGKRRGWRGFGLGWLAGISAFAIQLTWLAVVSPLGLVVLPLYLGLFPAAFAAFAATWGRPPSGDQARGAGHLAPLHGLRVAFQAAAVWSGLEILRGWLFTGFGWNALGVAFHDHLVMAQAADLLGVSGLSLLLVLFQAVLVQAVARLAAGAQPGDRRPRVPRWDFIAACALVAACLCYGLLRLAQDGRGESLRLRALLVQVNIPHEGARVLWDPHDIHAAYEDDTLEALEALQQTNEARLQAAVDGADEGEVALDWPDWVLWPESALTGRLLRTADGEWGAHHANLETIRRVREGGPFTLIYGINELEAERQGEMLVMKPDGRAFNSLVVMDPEDALQTFRKRHLVIFGETIPLAEQLTFLKRIYEQQSGEAYGGSFSRGDSLEPLPVDLRGRQIGVIPSICFEDTVPRLKRRFVRDGPQLIVNLTNDGWFDQSPAAAQHFANARFRAIELRRPMLRCANTGISAALSAAGSSAHPDDGRSQLLLDEDGSHFTRRSLFVELDIPLDPPRTLYARVGDGGLLTLAAAGLLLAWRGRRGLRVADSTGAP